MRLKLFIGVGVLVVLSAIAASVYTSGYPWTCNDAKTAETKAADAMIGISKRVTTSNSDASTIPEIKRRSAAAQKSQADVKRLCRS